VSFTLVAGPDRNRQAAKFFGQPRASRSSGVTLEPSGRQASVACAFQVGGARFAGLSEQHIAHLDSTLKNMGGHEASAVKSAVSQFEGLVAGMIDRARKTKVSKALRDDYTALSLCTVSYTMLHATASAMGETTVAALAQKHLEDYAQCVMSIAEEIPAVVVQELQGLGLNVDTSAIAQSVETTQRAWRGKASTTAGLN